MTQVAASTDVLRELDSAGVVVLPDFMEPIALEGMREAFGAVLARQRWNDVGGFEKTEPYRHMVQDVLALEQGFVDLAVNPVVMDTLRSYIGPGYQLVEAKGWLSIPTTRDFHGWHGDAWYDQKAVVDAIPREVKLAFYLTDVTTGYFEYVRGSHRQQAPRTVRDQEVERYPASDIVKCAGRAGTAILFDTSGIHRQSVPMLQPRWAIFYNYHDPSIPLQREDVEYYRYHPLILNAAFLGALGDEERRVLGFGDKRNYRRAFQRRSGQPIFQHLVQRAHDVHLRVDEVMSRVRARLSRLNGR
jgi:hypothetical protein